MTAGREEESKIKTTKSIDTQDQSDKTLVLSISPFKLVNTP